MTHAHKKPYAVHPKGAFSPERRGEATRVNLSSSSSTRVQVMQCKETAPGAANSMQRVTFAQPDVRSAINLPTYLSKGRTEW